ncbi:EAL domain-containing protein [Halothiobacillus sp. DCM-1]|uniref:EAL domain-containing protein n=1 Tax=Halothiobacillus sp. DCM-1 TaxID=3112558 RepID=UPI0032561575
MRISLPLQFILFLGLQIALSIGLVFYLNSLATSNYQSLSRATAGFVEASKSIESLRQSFARSSNEIEAISNRFGNGERIDVRDQALALQQLAAAIRNDAGLNGLRDSLGGDATALAKQIDQQAQTLITAAARAANAAPNEVALLQNELRQQRSQIMVQGFGALINAANRSLETTLGMLRGTTESTSHQYLTLLIIFIVLQFALMATAFWLLNHQLRQLANVTDRLIEGEATAALPQQKRADQIGRLARAVQQFRTTLITLSDSREQLKAILKKHDDETMQRRRAEKQLQLSASVFDNVQEAVLLTDISGHVTRANTAAQTLLKQNDKQLASRPLLETLLGVDSAVIAPLWQQVLEQGYWLGEVSFTPERATPIVAQVSIKRVGEPREGKGHVIFVLNDHTEMRRREQEMKFLAEQDTVTTLFNRHYFVAEGNRRLEANPRQALGIVLIGLDSFRAVNDALGHRDGDRILYEVGQRLLAVVGNEATLARVGGDEFAFYVVPRSDAVEDTRQVAEAALQAIRETLSLNSYHIALKASGGISTYPLDGDNIEDLLKTNEIALSTAKAEGGNQLYVHGAKVQNQARRRFMLQQALEKALGNRELRLAYQPQVALANGQISGFEVLMRWRHGGEWITPGEFIPLAEETDLIVRYTEWALSEGAKRVREWQRQTEQTFHLSVNLPPRLLLVDKIDQRLAAIAKPSGLPLSTITLEITESSFGNDPALMTSQLKKLAMQGFSIAIDDFGTGYSSLAYLSQLPISKIKIDKKFVDLITDDKESCKLVASILAMAKSLELDIVVEGVERPEQLIQLKRFDTRMDIQGFVFDPPQNEDYWEGLFMNGEPHAYEVP